MTYVPARDLPVAQQIVLLDARGGALARKLLAHLAEMGFGPPSPRDYVEMIKRRAITNRAKLGEPPVYVVTPGGLHDAQAILRELARKFGVHHVEFARAVGNSGPSVRCIACGWSTFKGRSRSADLILSNYAALHLQQAEQGTLPPAYVLPRLEGASP